MKNLFKYLTRTICPAAVIAAGVGSAQAQDDLVVTGSERRDGSICYNWPTLREKEANGMITLTAGGTARICADPSGVIAAPVDPTIIFNTQNVVCEVFRKENPRVAVPSVCPIIPTLQQ